MWYLQLLVTFSRLFAIFSIKSLQKTSYDDSWFSELILLFVTNLLVIFGRVTNIRKLKLYLRTYLMKKELHLSQTRRCFIWWFTCTRNLVTMPRLESYLHRYPREEFHYLQLLLTVWCHLKQTTRKFQVFMIRYFTIKLPNQTIINFLFPNKCHKF